MYILESVYIDSHEPDESIHSLWCAGYTVTERGDGIRGSGDFLVLFMITGAWH